MENILCRTALAVSKTDAHTRIERLSSDAKGSGLTNIAPCDCYKYRRVRLKNRQGISLGPSGRIRMLNGSTHVSKIYT